MTTKTFYHRTAGSRFIFPDGAEISFAGGRFTTSDPAKIAELDKIANLPASQVFTTTEAPVGVEERMVKRELDEVATGAFDAAHKIPAGAKTVAMPVTGDAKPTLQHLQEKGVDVTTAVVPIDPIAKAKAALARQSEGGAGNAPTK